MATTKTSTKFRPLPVISPELVRARGMVERLSYHPNETLKTEAKASMEAVTRALNAPIREALAAVNGKASSFCITDPDSVRYDANRAERALDNAGIPESERAGTIVTAQPSGPSAKKYQFNAISTTITLRRAQKGVWLLVNVQRSGVYPRQAEVLDIQISAAAAECARKAVLRPFTVRSPGNPQATLPASQTVDNMPAAGYEPEGVPGSMSGEAV